MNPGFSKTFWISLFLLGSVLPASPAHGQTFIPYPVEQTALAIQWEKPFTLDVFAAYSSILEADAIVPLGSGRSLQIGVPLAVAGVDMIDGTSTYLGNIRASLLYGEPGSLSGFLGITLPTASNIGGPELAAVLGLSPSLDEFEKWTEDGISVRGAAIPSWGVGSIGRMGLRLGGAALTSTGFDDLNVFLRTAGWGRFPLGHVELRADLATSYEISGDDGFGEQLTAYLDLGAGILEVSGHPGLFVRLPLDEDARRFIDFSIGVSARF